MKKRSTRPLRFAVIGQGTFAQAAVLPAFERATGCELRAIFSQDEPKLRALRRKYGVAAALGYEQYDDYLQAGEVDAVYIALPNDMHADYTVRAARAGVHVLCEKPIATNSHDAERMVIACADNDVHLMVAYRLHFEAATLETIERVRRGVLGRPRFISTTFALQVQDDNIRTRRASGGGPLLDLGITCVNAARAIFRAEPTEVVAMSATMRGDRRFREIDEQVTAILRFPGERLAQLTCSFGAYDHSALTVVGEKGRIRMDPAYESASGLTVQMDITNRKQRRRTFQKRDQIAAELIAFARSVRAGREPEPSGEEGLADLHVLEAIQRSTESHRLEGVTPIERRARPSKDATDRPWASTISR
ncbi:MAG TPA: Gfo/Idh/MocA family oxidoreductase [Polyangia bacterium]|nr:Gfo/Idh/MocA family oxidoreductase [Polyangia bacterium]